MSHTQEIVRISTASHVQTGQGNEGSEKVKCLDDEVVLNAFKITVSAKS